MARHSETRQVGTEGLGLWGQAKEEGVKAALRMAGIDPSARTSDPETSHLAAASMRSAAHTQRLQILEYLGRCGERGATADETDTALGWRNGRAGRRYGELVTLGLVLVASGTRKTSTGRDAQVYCLPIFCRVDAVRITE